MDYLVTVIAVGGGIVGLKVLINAATAGQSNTIAQDVKNVFMMMY
jgi:glycerol-3-phosphate dehydrogenase